MESGEVGESERETGSRGRTRRPGNYVSGRPFVRLQSATAQILKETGGFFRQASTNARRGTTGHGRNPGAEGAERTRYKRETISRSMNEEQDSERGKNGERERGKKAESRCSDEYLRPTFIFIRVENTWRT